MKKKVILGAICSLLIIGAGSYYINYKNLKNNSKTNISKINEKEKVNKVSSNNPIRESNKKKEVNKKTLNKPNNHNYLENNKVNKKNSINKKKEYIKEYPKNNEVSPRKKEDLDITKNVTTFVSDNSKKSFKRYEKILKDIKNNINVFHENLNEYIPNENTINMSSNIKAQDIHKNIINLKNNFKDLKELQTKGVPTSNIDNYSKILNVFNEYLDILQKSIKFDWDFEHTGLIDRSDKKVLELEAIKKNLDDRI